MAGISPALPVFCC